MNKDKVYHQLDKYKNNNHATIAGVFVVIGLLMLFGISSSPKNIIIGSLCGVLAILTFQKLKTTKPIIISNKSICLGKFVNGYNIQVIEPSTLKSIELVSTTKDEYNPKMAMATGDGNIKIYEYYYLLTLKDYRSIKFDDLYDKELQNDLKNWCQNNDVEIDLEVKKIIKKNDSY